MKNLLMGIPFVLFTLPAFAAPEECSLRIRPEWIYTDSGSITEVMAAKGYRLVGAEEDARFVLEIQQKGSPIDLGCVVADLDIAKYRVTLEDTFNGSKVSKSSFRYFCNAGSPKLASKLLRKVLHAALSKLPVCWGPW